MGIPWDPINKYDNHWDDLNHRAITEFQYVSFTTQAQYLKINHIQDAV